MKTLRGLRFFESLIGRMETSEFKTTDLYRWIEETNAEFGLTTEHTAMPSIVKRLVSLIDGAVEISIDTEYKGRGRKPSIFRVNRDLALQLLNKDQGNGIKAANPVLEKKLESKSGKKRIYKSFYGILENTYNTKELVVRNLSPEFMKDLDDTKICIMLDRLAMFNLETCQISFRCRNDIRDSMILLDRSYKDLYGAELGACARFKMIPAQQSKPKETDPDYINYIVYRALLHDGKLDIPSVLKLLRGLGYLLDQRELVGILNKSSFQMTNHGELVLARDGAPVVYDPKTKVTIIHARIGMTLDEVRKFIPDSNLVSKITETDGIYSLSVNQSFESMEKLVKLFRTFRGNDMIIGNDDLVSNLKIQVLKQEGLYRRDSILFRLEN